MADIIQLLPDSVANQIAAGEVIQRPASVVKELVENAVDAGSTSIRILIKDAGRTLVQIIDNGCGMSETDARLSFERHATSKIKTAADLFAIHTMGFRGEALASIAAISHLELRTKRSEDELGTRIIINGSEVESNEPCSCPDGSNFMIKNLFFNVPARRKFLKSNSTELRHIIEEVQRIAYANPDISIQLVHNESEIYNLEKGNYKKRIVSIIGKNRDQNLISLNTETSLAKVEGFIGKPEFARKTSGEQYFFVNNRFMKHPYLYKAVMKAYEKILQPNTYPSFFIYLTVDPKTIDINIHPTKTEVKFENETAIWQILQASVKEALGKFNIVPSLDFNTEAAFAIPTLSKATEFKMPGIQINEAYNPFEEERKLKSGFNSNSPDTSDPRESLAKWQMLYDGLENNERESGQDDQQTIAIDSDNKSGQQASVIGQTGFLQYKDKYILTSVKSGLMIIDQRRAHERILFEKYLITLSNKIGIAQKTLFPVTMDLDPKDFVIICDIIPDLKLIGFDITEFGKNTIAINGSPAGMESFNITEMVEGFLEEFNNNQVDIKIEVQENIAGSMAKAASINYRKKMTYEEMRELIDELFACSSPNFTSDGKPVISIMMHEEIENRLK